MLRRAVLAGIIVSLFVCGAAAADEAKCLGTWVRQATYVNGELVGGDPAVMTLKKGSFTSTSGPYATAGTLAATGDTMTMVMTESNCPGVTPPYTVNYTYSLSDGGKTMAIVTGPVKEIYRRK